MKTVGQLLKQYRQDNRITLKSLSESTKIRPEYLSAIERDAFGELPSAAFVKGFIQSFAKGVGVKPETALAVFRRDYDLSAKGRIVPRGLTKPLKTKTNWFNPKNTTAIFIAFSITLLTGYTLIQLRNISAAPKLVLTYPDGEIIYTTDIEVTGYTEPDSTLTVNDQPVALDLEGNFKITITLDQNQADITLKSTSRRGKTTTLVQPISVQAQE